jgi:hypothetical protein
MLPFREKLLFNPVSKTVDRESPAKFRSQNISLKLIPNIFFSVSRYNVCMYVYNLCVFMYYTYAYLYRYCIYSVHATCNTVLCMCINCSLFLTISHYDKVAMYL